MQVMPERRAYNPGEDNERASILIVDDLPEKLLVFGTLLEELGHNLVFAKSGAEALREVLKQEFAVILLDVNMPDMDGFETAAMIRRYRRSALTPIIFITAYADEIQTARGYSLGAVDYILSPVVPEVLSSKIKVFIDLYLLQRRIRRQADERVALAAAEAARRAAEEGARRSSFLVQAGRTLGDSLDVDVAVRRLLGLIVPELADVAAVLLRDDGAGGSTPTSQRLGQCVHLAWQDVSTRQQTSQETTLQEWPEAVRAAWDKAQELRAASPLQPEALQWLSQRIGQNQMPHAPGALQESLLLPLIAGERSIGALLVATYKPRNWGLLQELAAQAAIALENARLYSTLQAEIVERRAAEIKLQQSNQRKDEFLAMLSHELRNPLAPIRNAVDVIRRLAPQEERLCWANDVMDRQVRHLTRLVEELLDVARINQGKITLHLAPVDLRAVIEHGVETVKPFIEHRAHQLTLMLPDTPVWLRGDFSRLSQVVANLLNNAAKYTEQGGQIRLSLSIEGEQALIVVADNGMGIEAELLPHVFDLFEQGRRSLDRSQGGLGVGLTLVQRLVHLHHGLIEARSPGQGRGSEFRIHLPCMNAAAATAPQTPAAASTTPEPRRRVLIVDDNADAAESVAMVLDLHGHEVKAVGDGAQALASLEQFSPDAVVLDIGLPGEDGYEVARRLRRHPLTRDALLIALTGYGQREDVARATEAGFDRHFVKPADPELLAQCIAQARLVRKDAAGAPAGSTPAADGAFRLRAV
ncbi:MAG: response regulator [Aquabacterium sp.]